MPETAGGQGAAFDASAATEDDAPLVVTAAHVAYLATIADQEADGVKLVERQIKDLQASLAQRREAAERAKADLADARRRLKQREG